MNQRGFTLVELLIAMIIIGILASVAIPMMSAATRKAIVSEAITSLGTIRTAMRTYYLEYGQYVNKVSNLTNMNFKRVNINAYGTADLDGTYFDLYCYTNWQVKYYDSDPTHYSVGCMPKGKIAGGSGIDDAAPQAAKALSLPNSKGNNPYVSMHEDGSIYSDIYGLGYPEDPAFK